MVSDLQNNSIKLHQKKIQIVDNILHMVYL